MRQLNPLNRQRGSFIIALFCLVIPISIAATIENKGFEYNSNNDVAENPSFEITIFSKSDLLEILGFNNCTGIRFYMAADNNPRSPNGLIAVGITDDGSEITNNKFIIIRGKDYFWKAPNAEPNFNSAERINENSARSMVEDLQIRKDAFLIIDFSIEDIKRILDNPSRNVAGLKVVPKEVDVDQSERMEEKLNLSMGMVGVDKEFQEIGEMQIKSQPCPPLCPYPGKYLIPTP